MLPCSIVQKEKQVPLQPGIKGTNNSGAVFSLMTRDGRQDHILTALDRLEKRMAGIRVAKKLMGVDPIPTMAELEESHVMFLKGSFKPYIPVASEYLKTGSQTPVGFAKEITFEIPQFGDFISDQVIHIVISGFGVPNGDATTQPLYRYATLPGIKLC